MPTDQTTLSVPEGQQTELARWTHLWAAAAVLVLAQIDETWDIDDPVGSIGKRDVLALVLLDAVRNTYRGASATLGRDDPEVRRFEEAAPSMKDLRDRFEHFDEYLRGQGRAQRRRGQPDLDLGGLPGLAITGSRSGGRNGHTVDVRVIEASGETRYNLETQTAVEAARRLARATLNGAGLLDARHIARCSTCADEVGPS